MRTSANHLGDFLKKMLACAVLAILMLTSCSSSPQKVSQSSEEAVAGGENDRGNVMKELGETAAFGGDSVESSAVKFKVTSIQPFECTREFDEPGNGHMIAVALEVETTKDLDEQVGADFINFEAGGWKGYESDGTRLNTLSSNRVYNCLDDRSSLLHYDIGPAEKAAGIVLLDAAEVPKSISFSFPTQDNGWEWEYKAP